MLVYSFCTPTWPPHVQTELTATLRSFQFIGVRGYLSSTFVGKRFQIYVSNINFVAFVILDRLLVSAQNVALGLWLWCSITYGAYLSCKPQQAGDKFSIHFRWRQCKPPIGRTDGREERTDGTAHRRKGGRTKGRRDGRKGERTDGRADIRKGGRTDGVHSIVWN